MNQPFYKLLFAGLIISILSAKVEISFVIGVVAFLFSFRSKLSTNLFYVILIFTFIFLVGLLGILRHDASLSVFVKDVIYYSRPIVVLIASYNLIKVIKDKRFLFKIFIGLGFASAIWHFIQLGIHASEITSVNLARARGGRYNHLELVALIFVTLIRDRSIRNTYGNLTYKFLVLALIISNILYFSRVMIAVYFAFLLAYYGYLNVTAKGVKAAIFGTISIVLFSVMINQFDVDSNDSGLKGFIFKIQNSYSEIFESLDIENIKRDKRELWKHWRGYEAQSAIEQINEAGTSAWIFGKGFGSQVDLGTSVELSGEEIRYIPILHNGYIYILLKSGFFGLMLYIMYIIYLYSFSRVKSASSSIINMNSFLVGCAFYVAVSSLVVSGVYKPYDYSTLLVGSILFLKGTNYEDWNSRNTRNT